MLYFLKKLIFIRNLEYCRKKQVYLNMSDYVWSSSGKNLVVEDNNIDFLATLPDESFNLVYIDPPFNTGRTQKRILNSKTKDLGFSKKKLSRDNPSDTLKILAHYDDDFLDYWEFLQPRLLEAWRLLAQEGTLYLHLDYREIHYAKVMLDMIFGRECFLNEIIWAYDYGARAKRKWPTKHDNILVYVKDPKSYYFNNESLDREPYMAPGLVTPEKVALGKLPTDVWWHTIVSPTGKEKTGYPTQKPEGILRRIIQASSREGDWVLDFFAGSGTTGVVSHKLNRKFVLVDQNPQSLEVISERLSHTKNPENTVYIRKIF